MSEPKPRPQRKDAGIPRAPYKRRNNKRTKHATISLDIPVGEQLKPLRERQNLSLAAMAELMSWSPNAGPQNIRNMEDGCRSYASPKEIPAMNTVLKYLRALDVERVTFIL